MHNTFSLNIYPEHPSMLKFIISFYLTSVFRWVVRLFPVFLISINPVMSVLGKFLCSFLISLENWTLVFAWPLWRCHIGMYIYITVMGLFIYLFKKSSISGFWPDLTFLVISRPAQRDRVLDFGLRPRCIDSLGAWPWAGHVISSAKRVLLEYFLWD